MHRNDFRDDLEPTFARARRRLPRGLALLVVPLCMLRYMTALLILMAGLVLVIAAQAVAIREHRRTIRAFGRRHQTDRDTIASLTHANLGLRGDVLLMAEQARTARRGWVGHTGHRPIDELPDNVRPLRPRDPEPSA